MNTGDSLPSEATHAKPLPTGSTVAEALAEFRRAHHLNPLSEEEAAKLPPWTDKEAEAFARSIRETKYPPTGFRGSHTVAEALDAYFLSKGITPPSKEDLANLPPWPKEDADAFERVINEMFERIDEGPPAS